MRPTNRALLCLSFLFCFCFLVLRPLHGADHVLLFPSGSTTQLPVLRASDLSLAGNIIAPASAHDAVQSIDGQKYYILARSATQSLTVVSATTLETLNILDLGATLALAEPTPDGRYLFAGTGDLRIIDLATDQQVKQLDVGGAPIKILFDNGSQRAFVLSNSGRTLAVVSLQTLEVTRSIALPNAQDAALTANSSRLVVSFTTGIRQYRTIDLSEISNIPTKVPLVNSTVYPLPSGAKAIIENRGAGTSRTAQFVDLDLGTAADVGNVGQTQLRQIQIFDNTRGYAIDQATNDVVALDFTATPDVTATPLPFGSDVKTIELSPSRRTLYVSSLSDAAILMVDTATNAITRSQSLSVAPNFHRLLFEPSRAAPKKLTINGGNNQFYPPNNTLPIPLSVEVTDDLGRPIPNVPVLFQDPTNAGLILSPQQPSFTNARGIATATVQIPALERPSSPDDPEVDPENPQPLPPVLQPITISATTAGVDPVLFTATVIHGSGLIKVSGDNQGVDENTPFPLPLVLLATDQRGFPLPAGTPITFGFSLASCPTELTTDENGFITVRNCSAFPLSTNPHNTQLFSKGHVTASYFTADQRQVRVAFNFINIRSGSRFGLTKLGGDNQTGRSGEELPLKLSFRLGLTSGFGGTIDPFNVEFTQISGPPVVLEKRNVAALMHTDDGIKVRLGENAGTSVIQARASVPGLPVVTYTVTATGGRPTSLEKSGDGQSGKIATNLASPLRVRVVNESGTFVPFPEVVWRVVQGDATLTVPPADQTGSNAQVRFGNTPGPVRVTAAFGSLQATFELTALAPVPASISTFSGQTQTLTTGVPSQPLVVRVTEIDNRPAAGAIITFSGPPNVRLHPVTGAPGNPVQVMANENGMAQVRAELLAAGALTESGAAPSQFSQTVTIVASAGPQLTTSFLLNVVGRNPAFESRQIVNAASFEAGIVPGGIVTIFGTGLMEGVVGIADAQVQTHFRGTTVRIGGVPAPLFMLSSGPQGEQINLQAPFELTPGQTTTVEIENNGSRSTVSGVPVYAAQPGIFEFSTSTGATYAAAVHLDYSLVSAENPARAGEVISLFATGAGPISPPVPTGTLGPAAPLPLSLVTRPVVIGVDDKGAQVLFQGYAPGFLGLYQFNFVVPPDVRCGQRALSLKVGDSFSKNTTLPILCQ